MFTLFFLICNIFNIIIIDIIILFHFNIFVQLLMLFVLLLFVIIIMMKCSTFFNLFLYLLNYCFNTQWRLILYLLKIGKIYYILFLFWIILYNMSTFYFSSYLCIHISF